MSRTDVHTLTNSRRTFVKNGIAFSLVTGIGAPLFASCNSANQKAAVITEFKQSALEYAYNALEDNIDAMTMEIHYTKHHAGYVGNLNAAVKEENIQVTSLEELMKGISKYTVKVRNNGGGHYNHEMFWKNLKPGGGEPAGEIKKSIEGSFGSIDAFRTEFNKAAATRCGSGWAWLTAGADGKLSVGSTPNQDNPLMDISEYKGIPLLALDVWEHAYYLHYQNRRADYINAFWNVVNWDVVNKRLLSI